VDHWDLDLATYTHAQAGKSLLKILSLVDFVFSNAALHAALLKTSLRWYAERTTAGLIKVLLANVCDRQLSKKPKKTPAFTTLPLELSISICRSKSSAKAHRALSN
jgi:hypothetical protein